MVKAYKSEPMAAVHEMVEGFHDSGAVDKQTMQEFDEACLTPPSLLTTDKIDARLLKTRKRARPRSP